MTNNFDIGLARSNHPTVFGEVYIKTMTNLTEYILVAAATGYAIATVQPYSSLLFTFGLVTLTAYATNKSVRHAVHECLVEVPPPRQIVRSFQDYCTSARSELDDDWDDSDDDTTTQASALPAHDSDIVDQVIAHVLTHDQLATTYRHALYMADQPSYDGKNKDDASERTTEGSH